MYSRTWLFFSCFQKILTLYHVYNEPESPSYFRIDTLSPSASTGYGPGEQQNTQIHTSIIILLICGVRFNSVIPFYGYENALQSQHESHHIQSYFFYSQPHETNQSGAKLNPVLDRSRRQTKTQSQLRGISISDTRSGSPKHRSGQLSALRKSRVQGRLMLEKASGLHPQSIHVGTERTAPDTPEKGFISRQNIVMLGSKWAGIRK